MGVGQINFPLAQPQESSPTCSDCVWLDAYRGIGKRQFQKKMNNPFRAFFFFLILLCFGQCFPGLISNAFGVGWYY